MTVDEQLAQGVRDARCVQAMLANERSLMLRIAELEAALRQIAEWNNGDDTTLGAIKLVALWRELAQRTLEGR